MKTEKNMRKGFGLTGKIAMFCIGLVSLVLTSCESELEIQQSYPFTVETMPVPKELNRMRRRKYGVNSKVRAILTVRSIRSVISSMTGKVP